MVCIKRFFDEDGLPESVVCLHILTINSNHIEEKMLGQTKNDKGQSGANDPAAIFEEIVDMFYLPDSFAAFNLRFRLQRE